MTKIDLKSFKASSKWSDDLRVMGYETEDTKAVPGWYYTLLEGSYWFIEAHPEPDNAQAIVYMCADYFEGTLSQCEDKLFSFLSGDNESDEWGM